MLPSCYHALSLLPLDLLLSCLPSLQLSADAALELLRSCRQERSGPQGAALAAPGGAATPQAAAAAAAAAAVVAVEQQLVYQHFEFRVDSIQLLAVNAELPSGGSSGGFDTGSGHDSRPRHGGGEPSDAASGGSGSGSGGSGGSGKRVVLQPFKIGGALKLHRITDVSCAVLPTRNIIPRRVAYGWGLPQGL
jgi:hypothetical protein